MPPASWIAARACRLTRFLTTAPPTLRETTSPYRPVPESARLAVWTTKCGVLTAFPSRKTRLKSAAERSLSSAGANSRSVSVGESGPALSPAPRNHRPTRSGAHPHSKAVSLCLVARVRLIGPFHNFLPGIRLEVDRGWRLSAPDYNRERLSRSRRNLRSTSALFPALRRRQSLAIIAEPWCFPSFLPPRGLQYIGAARRWNPTLTTVNFSTSVECPVDNWRPRTGFCLKSVFIPAKALFRPPISFRTHGIRP
ncbi:hypothetical protein BH23ACT12_BH23ACT12_07190 [soil metagenome]